MSQSERVRYYQRVYGPVAVNSRHGLAVVDARTCSVLYANDRFLASHGFPPDRSAPVPCVGLYSDGACEPDRCPAKGAAAAAAERRHELRRDGGDGLPARMTEVLATPIDPDGRGSSDEVLVIEKEDPAASEADPEEEREHLAAIARYSADAIIGLDRDDNVRSWNQGAAETFGYTDDEMIGREFQSLLPDDVLSSREYEALVREFRSRGLVKGHTVRLRSKEGRTVVCSITRSWFRDAAGRPRGSSVICRDVTMEVLLKELIEHQLRAMSVTHEIGDLLHSTRSVHEILQLILIGVTAGQGLGFNRAFLLLVEEDEDGSSWLRGRMAIGPPDADEANRIWRTLSRESMTLAELHRQYRDASESGEDIISSMARSIEVRLDGDDEEDDLLIEVIKHKRSLNVVDGRAVGAGGGQEFDSALIDVLQTRSFAIVPLSARERAVGALLVDNRITGVPVSDADLQMLSVFANHAGIAVENSQLRESLERRLDEVEQLNRAMRGHQERLVRAERLSVIGELAARVVHEVRNPLVAIGGFARLVRKGMDAQDPRSDYLRIINDEVARLERIVSELLDFSRPQSRLVLAPVGLNGLVHEVVQMATVEAVDHGVAVREAYDDAIGEVVIDGDKTRQVLLNIVKNAIDVLVEKGGTLRVESGLVDSDRFRVTIADDGPGIPPERRDQAFQPGFTTRPDGTGFGLAIARRLVELQGGQIGLRDGVEVGCTFDIFLPRRVEERSHDGEADAHPDRG